MGSVYKYFQNIFPHLRYFFELQYNVLNYLMTLAASQCVIFFNYSTSSHFNFRHVLYVAFD